MEFKKLRKIKKLMKNYEVIIYDEFTGEKLYHDLLPVGLSKNGSNMYKGLMISSERKRYDDLFLRYSDCIITDIFIEDEYKQIFVDIRRK